MELITHNFRSFFRTQLLASLSLGMAGVHLHAAAFTPETETVYLWNFDNPEAKVFADQISDVELLPNKKSGVTWGDGKFGKALNFPGDTVLRTRKDDKSSTLENAITVECWVNVADIGSECESAGIVENFDYRAKRGFRLAITKDRKVRWMIETSNGEKSLTSTQVIPQGEGIHIAATYDGSKMEIYVRGVLDSKKSQPNGLLTTEGSPVVVGFYTDDTRKGFFQGMIEGLRITRVAKTEFKVE